MPTVKYKRTSSTKSSPTKLIAGLPHYIGYLRVSKERDATGSFTFETQRQRIIEHLDREHGTGQYKIEFLQDDGLSGGYGLTPTALQPKVRPTLRTMADLLQSGEYAGVIVYGQNRFFRNARGLMEMVEDILLPLRVPLLSATESIDIFSADGRMMLFMKGLFDEKQREDIIKRNKDAAASRAGQGYAIGQVGYGWMWAPGTESGKGQRRGIVPVESEKHWLLHIKERYLSGWNVNKIANELNNELDVPTPLQRGLWSSKAKKQYMRDGHVPRWSNTTVWMVLSNPLHAGLIKQTDGSRIQGRHYEERFWDPEVLEQIEQTKNERVSRFKTCTGQKNTAHLLNGIISCKRCGKRLYMSSTSETTKAYRSYKCQNGVKEGKHTCPEVVVRAQWAEDAVVEVIAKLTRQPEMRRLLEQEVKASTGQQDKTLLAEKAQLKRKLEQIGEKFERWADGFSKGVMSEKQFTVYSKKIEAEEAETSERLAEVEKALGNRLGRELWLQQIREQLENFSEVWEELGNDEKRNVLSLLIEEGGLTVDRHGRDVLLTIKVHLLPAQEKLIMYHTYRGVNRTRATGLQRLSMRHMVLLYYASQGKSRKECAELMGCKVPSIYTLEKTIRKNLGDVSWEEAVEMARERVQANVHQLPLGQPGRGAAHKSGKAVAGTAGEKSPGFLSPVLMEVFELFAQAATVSEVAERLHLSVTTVQGRRARILKAFGTSSMLDAVEKAKEQGILQ
jgi:site-specific DNA recombinase